MPNPTGTLALVTASPKLGEDCLFQVATDGLHGQQFPRVYVEARQNGVVVYGEIRELDGADGHNNPKNGPCTFPPLGGGSSDWINNTPPADSSAPADCVARLFYADQHGAQIDLDTVSFVATGV